MLTAPPDMRGDGAAREGRSWAWVLSALFALSLVIGVVAYWRFTRSDRFLARDLKMMASRGKHHTIEQCVDDLLGWSAHCEAMLSLCEASIPRMMEACLAAQERAAYCKDLGIRAMSTRFGFPECKVRKVDRSRKKVCALAYRTIAAHCAMLTKDRIP
jgi:hypothetical protein